MRGPGLKDDTVTVWRNPGLSSDDEGNAVGDLSVVFTGKGHLGTLSARDATVAGNEGASTDAVLAIKLPAVDTIRPGDVIDVRSQRWTVGHVEDVRSHVRVFVGRVG